MTNFEDENKYELFSNEENAEIPENESKPCCKQCSLAFKTWEGYEYHIRKTHVSYQPYQCLGCGSLFYTESEGRFHLKTEHHEQREFMICKITNFEKEKEASYFFQKIEFLKAADTQIITFDEQVPSSIYVFPTCSNILRADRIRFDVPKVLKPISVSSQESDNISFEEKYD